MILKKTTILLAKQNQVSPNPPSFLSFPQESSTQTRLISKSLPLCWLPGLCCLLYRAKLASADCMKAQLSHRSALQLALPTAALLVMLSFFGLHPAMFTCTVPTELNEIVSCWPSAALSVTTLAFGFEFSLLDY